MTTLQKTIVTAALAVLVGVGIYKARQAARLREQNRILQQQQAPLAGQVAALKAENERLSNLAVLARDAQNLSSSQRSELLKLRNQATLARTDAQELARLKTKLADQAGAMPESLAEGAVKVVSNAERQKQKEALASLARMKQALHLTDDQELAISNILATHIERHAAAARDLVLHQSTFEQFARAADSAGDQEAEIRAVLSAEQSAAYPGFLETERNIAADNSAQSEARRMAERCDLTIEQQARLREALHEINLKEPPDALSRQAIAQASLEGQFSEALQAGAELQTARLEEKLKTLGTVLTPDQIKAYREAGLEEIRMQVEAFKMMQQTPAVSR